MVIYSSTNSLAKSLGNSRLGYKVLVKQYVLLKTQSPLNSPTYLLFYNAHIFINSEI